MKQRHPRTALEQCEAREARQAKKPCETCAFTDCESWVADIGMHRKILDALQGRARFYCHEGLPVEGTSYQPPTRADGQIDAARLTPCGGFLRWALTRWRRPPREQAMAVMRTQRRMLTRWLAGDDPLAREWRANGWNAADVQMAVQLTDWHKQQPQEEPHG